MHRSGGRDIVLKTRSKDEERDSWKAFLPRFNPISLLPSAGAEPWARGCLSGESVENSRRRLQSCPFNRKRGDFTVRSTVVDHLVPGFDAGVAKVKSTASQLKLKTETLRIGVPKASDADLNCLEPIKPLKHAEYPLTARFVTDIPLASTSGRGDGEFWKERRKGRLSISSCKPLGKLHVLDNVFGARESWELPRGQNLEECTSIGKNHSVLTSFENGKVEDESSVWLCTSHKLGDKHLVATEYAADLKGGTNFNVNTSHVVLPNSTISTSLHANSFGDTTVEVELQREKKRGKKKITESIVANLKTGDKLLKLQTKEFLKGGFVVLNSVNSNLRDQHSVRFIATSPLSQTFSFTESFATGIFGGRKSSINLSQKIFNHQMIVGSFSTNFREDQSISLEARHEMEGLRNLIMKLSKDRNASCLDLLSSFSSNKDYWSLGYKNSSGDGQSVNVEWRREITPDHFCFTRASVARGWIYRILAEASFPF